MSCALRSWRRSAEIVTRPTPLIELPVAASEDRVVGSLDLEHALTEGQRRFEPGLLAQANRGLLYVDEVNLLDDHLVDVLLDAAAMGVNTVEREGISVSHPARFILVGTMNPEEGELRPQLLDRFGLVVEISGITNIAGRIAVIERRMGYDAEPASLPPNGRTKSRNSPTRFWPHARCCQRSRSRAAIWPLSPHWCWNWASMGTAPIWRSLRLRAHTPPGRAARS